MTDDGVIRSIEIAAARAWPASETAAADGWLLRHTPAVVRARSNAALPPPRAGADTDAVAAIEAWYRARGARPRVQVSPLEWHPRLDAVLAAAGWEVAYGAVVLTAPVAGVLAAGPAAEDVVLERRPTPRWLGAWGACEGRDAASCAAHGEAILEQVVPRATFAAIHDPASGTPVAVGLAVRDAELAGIFCMATHVRHRRRGAAARVLRALAADAAAHGVERLYLQVDSRNDEAAGLYEAHGFRRSHGYHFRVAPEG